MKISDLKAENSSISNQVIPMPCSGSGPGTPTEKETSERTYGSEAKIPRTGRRRFSMNRQSGRIRLGGNPIIFFTSIIVSGLLLSQGAFAESSSVLSSARELAKQGLQAYDSGRYEEAADKLGKAYQVVHVPTLAVNQARALVKLGRWVAASELYLEAQRIPKDRSWQSTQTDALRDAEKERADLLPRIPRLTVVVKGAGPNEVEVTIDGGALPAALLGTEQLQDPGMHKVQGAHGTEIVTETIAVKEGDRANVTLQFKLVSAAVVQSAPGAPNQQNNALPPQMAAPTQPTAPSPTVPPPAAPIEKNNTQKTIGWIGIGVGGAGLIVGSVTGLMAMSKRSSLSDTKLCSADLQHCPPEFDSKVSSYNSLRTVSTIGFFAGGVLAAAGITLVLTAPKQESKATVGLWLSPNGAALTGGF
jgi:hypothetical protein